MFNLTDEEWEATFSLLAEAREILDKNYRPKGYILGWDCGTMCGKDIIHAHLHVVPTFDDEYPAEYFDSLSCC